MSIQGILTFPFFFFLFFKIFTLPGRHLGYSINKTSVICDLLTEFLSYS